MLPKMCFGRSPLCLSIHSVSVSLDRCQHSQGDRPCLMAQEKSSKCHPHKLHVHRDKCLVVLCVLTDSPFGHDQRMLSLLVALDTDLKDT